MVDNPPMEVPEKSAKDQIMYDKYNTARSKVIAGIGIIITILAIGVVFFISSLEGTREVRASNYTSGKILNIWRVDEGLEDTNDFPEPNVTLIEYKGREYYYTEKLDSEGNVIDWYFAFDGGLNYVFQDYKYYVLTAIVVTIAIFVAYVNYISAKNNCKEKDRFVGALKYYKKAKDDTRGKFHLIPFFCRDKKREARETLTMDIVEEAGIIYAEYKKDDFDKTKIEKWQLKILKKIRKIKIEPLNSNELLQEKPIAKGARISFLPAGEKETEMKFLRKTAVQKFITIGMSGAVVAFGIVLGNWALGATYGFTVALGGVTASLAGTDYVYNTLRNRYIAKADYLIEFNNNSDKYEQEYQLTLPKLPEVDDTIKKITKEGEPDVRLIE